MKTETAPTSPKYKIEKYRHAADKAMDAVWKEEAIEQPAQIPWGRIFLLAVMISIAVAIGLLAGWRWLSMQYPHSWIGQWWPQATNTTVVQPVKETTGSSVPAAVVKTAKRVYGLAANSGAAGTYTTASIQGTAVPLSTSGWLLSISGAAGDGKTVALPPVGQPLVVRQVVQDPATDAAFLKVEGLTDQPIQFGTVDLKTGNQPVWIVSAFLGSPEMISRQVVAEDGPAYQNGDRLDRRLILDQAVDAPPGTPVLNRSGQVVGLLETGTKVMPNSAIESIISFLIKEGAIERPSLGLRYLDQGAAIVTGQPTATGFLVGTDSKDPAIVPKGPADQAIIRAGDIITEIEKHPVADSLFSVLQQYAPGQKMALTVVRKSKAYRAVVTLGTLHE